MTFNLLLGTYTSLFYNVYLYTIHNHNTRNKNKLVQPQRRLAKVRTSVAELCIRFYNKIPDDIVNLPEKFKCFVK